MSTRSAKIEEVVWTPGSRPGLDKAVQRFSYEPSTETRRLWAACLPGDPPRVVLCTRYRERDARFPTFARYLREVRPTGLLDDLYVADTYRQSRILGEPFPERERGHYPSDGVVDDILSASFGHLLWQFQMERLAQALGLPRRSAINLRRKVNQKQASALDAVQDGEEIPAVKRARAWSFWWTIAS
jgi:hypothetical protein